MSYEWDPQKSRRNLLKHGIHFADAAAVFEDEYALSQEDPRGHPESRYVVVGMDHLGQILTVVFTHRGENIRLISARKATLSERRTYEDRR